MTKSPFNNLQSKGEEGGKKTTGYPAVPLEPKWPTVSSMDIQMLAFQRSCKQPGVSQGNLESITDPRPPMLSAQNYDLESCRFHHHNFVGLQQTPALDHPMGLLRERRQRQRRTEVRKVPGSPTESRTTFILPELVKVLPVRI